MVSPAASQAVHRGPIPLDRRGELFELVMEPVLKTGGCKSLGGSNPSLSAILEWPLTPRMSMWYNTAIKRKESKIDGNFL